MLLSLAAPAFATLWLIAAATLVGLETVRKLITIYEAKHELRQGSTGFLRSMAGWSLIALWLMSTWFVATIIGDWGATGDLGGAVNRSLLRLRLLLEIAIALMGQDG